MRQKISTAVVIAMCVLLVASTFEACSQPGAEKAPSATNTAATASTAKLPITTSSEEAKKQFVEGRDKTERLLIADSLANFDKAIELDPNFASAELARAQASQTAKEFFDHLAKAVALADKVSEGEKLLIVSTKAGVDGDNAKQKESLDRLVALFPGDERVQVIVGGYYFGQQDYKTALEHYNESIKINANYAPAYNIAGYAYRQNGDMDKAEQSFKKYIELIPNDPNPYDSYGELLLKMGRYDDSIVQYKKALAIDPNFMASRQGVAMNLLYSGKAADRPNRISAYIWNAAGGEGSGAYFEDKLTEHKWIHIVATYDDPARPDARVRIYRNGVASPHNTSPGTLYKSYSVKPASGAAPLRFGTRDRKTFLTGGLDEVAIYPYVLTPDQIRQHWQTGVGRGK